jgi:hypothetical protein
VKLDKGFWIQAVLITVSVVLVCLCNFFLARYGAENHAKLQASSNRPWPARCNYLPLLPMCRDTNFRSTK